MSEPVSWTLQLAVRDGRREDVRALMGEMVSATREEEPGTVIYEWFFGPDGTTCHIVEGYTDHGAVMTHLGNFGAKYADRFLACLEPTAFTVYGDPGPEARAILEGFGAQFLEREGGFRR